MTFLDEIRRRAAVRRERRHFRSIRRALGSHTVRNANRWRAS